VLVEDEAEDVVDCAMVSKDRVIRRIVALAREKVAIVVFAQRGRFERGGCWRDGRRERRRWRRGC